MKVVFLDIDGVLQPFSKKVRVNYINNDIISLLNNKYHINYNRYDIKDVSRVYYDWDKSAIERLRKILSVTDSKIIISSNWRNENKPNKIHDLLKIHNLEIYYYCDNKILNSSFDIFENRANEIKDSLNRYDISNYVVIDDWYPLKEYFKNNIVCTNNIIEDNDVISAIKILSKYRQNNYISVK